MKMCLAFWCDSVSTSTRIRIPADGLQAARCQIICNRCIVVLRSQGAAHAGLAGLPAPQYEYQIAMPEVAEDGMDGDDIIMEEDAADVVAKKRAAAKAREEAALRKRSQVKYTAVSRACCLWELSLKLSFAKRQAMKCLNCCDASNFASSSPCSCLLFCMLVL